MGRSNTQRKPSLLSFRPIRPTKTPAVSSLSLSDSSLRADEGDPVRLPPPPRACENPPEEQGILHRPTIRRLRSCSRPLPAAPVLEIRVFLCATKVIDFGRTRSDMEPSSQPQPVMGVATGGSQAYPPAVAAYPPPAMVPGAPAVVPPGSQPTAPFPTNPAQLSAQHQLVYQQAQQFHQQLQQQQQQQLREFWASQMDEIGQTTDFKNHSLPLARIKKIMKADEDVRMISAEAPVVFAKACEVFILELTLRSWMHTEENKRRTLQKNDIAAAITRTDIYDFLVDIVPRDEMKEEGLGLPRVGLPPAMGAPADTYPYYYVPAQQVAGAGMMYGGQQGHPMTYVWQQPQGQQEEPPEEQQQSLPESS